MELVLRLIRCKRRPTVCDWSRSLIVAFRWSVKLGILLYASRGIFCVRFRACGSLRWKLIRASNRSPFIHPEGPGTMRFVS